MGAFLLSASRILILSLFLIGVNLEKKATKVLSKYYKEDIILLDTFRRDLDGTLFYVSNSDDVAFIGHARSKFDTFDFLVLLDNSGTIKHVSVLVYRENYGGEIASKRWLRKWIGINQRVTHIDGISGATISVNSLKHSINKLLDSI